MSLFRRLALEEYNHGYCFTCKRNVNEVDARECFCNMYNQPRFWLELITLQRYCENWCDESSACTCFSVRAQTTCFMCAKSLSFRDWAARSCYCEDCRPDDPPIYRTPDIKYKIYGTVSYQLPLSVGVFRSQEFRETIEYLSVFHKDDQTYFDASPYRVLAVMNALYA